MATSDAQDGFILLSDVPGDARRVQMILAEWGMDKATINRMLREQQQREAAARRQPRASDNEAVLPARGNSRPVAH